MPFVVEGNAFCCGGKCRCAWRQLSLALEFVNCRGKCFALCKENKHGKHAQTESTCKHGQGTCRQLPDVHTRRARTGRGMACTSKEQIRAHKELCRCGLCLPLIVLQAVFVETCTMHRAKHVHVHCMWITQGHMIVLSHRLAAAARQPAVCGSVACPLSSLTTTRKKNTGKSRIHLLRRASDSHFFFVGDKFHLMLQVPLSQLDKSYHEVQFT